MPEQLLAGGDGGLDRPAVRVAGHDAFDAVAAVGGEQCQDLVAAGVADQHDATGLLRGGCGAGQFVVAVFVGVGLSCGNACNSCCDKGSAEFGEHVFEGDVVLVRVPGLGVASGVEVVGVVAVQRVPDDDEAVDA